MKNSPLNRFYMAVGYLLGIHVLALLIFTLLRLALFLCTGYDFPEEIEGDWLLQSIAFVKGVWFDNVIACYILLLPLVVMWVASMANCASKWLYKATYIWFVILYAVAFGITAANIPYFGYFFKVINSSIFNWFEYAGTTAGMIFGESSYYLPMAFGVLAILVFAVVAKIIANRCYKQTQTIRMSLTIKEFLIVLLLGALLVGLCLFGIRGRRGYNPIKVSQAYYCQDPFLNQVGINPVFNLLTSYMDDQRKENRRLELMPDEVALETAGNLLGREGLENVSPLAREVLGNGESIHKGKNVVFIFMESMSANLMGTFGNADGLTPFLDSIYRNALVFNNIYSAGIHTNHGMYSTLYSFPTIMKRNAMKGSAIPVYSGFPTVLKENGYRNLFFMTHESQYDNMNAFFRTNGFDEIYSQEDYPKEKIANHFGVQDDYLYEYAVPVLDEKWREGNPFFAVLLSISNHPPYVIPSKFVPRSGKVEQQIVEYADWAIKNFMEAVKEKEWYDNTIFVFMGDHGKLVGTPECEIPQCYNHVPLMIYGKGIEPLIIDSYGGQIDVAPTLLDMLGIGYIQNNYGINLFKEERPCIFYGADNLIAARDSARLYIYSPETGQEFRYDTTGNKVVPASDNEEFEKLKEYCFSMLQSAEYMVREGNITDKPVGKGE